MKYIYIDNYRGFRRQVLPLQDVNFFVGENSTGKSSIMHLVNIMSSIDFWFYQDFSLVVPEMSVFDDFVSKLSEDRKSFTFGFLSLVERGKRKDNLAGFFVRCKSVNSMPQVNELIYVQGDRTTHFVIYEKSFKFKSIDIDIQNMKSNPEAFIVEVASRLGAKAVGYSRYGLNYKIGKNSLVTISSILDSIDKVKDSKQAPRFNLTRFPLLYGKFVWIAPIRTKPKDTYTGLKEAYSPEGGHTPYMLKSIIQGSNKKDRGFESKLNDFGVESGMFEQIRIKSYGRKATSPFEVNVVLNKRDFTVANVGYGVSQVLPVISELLIATPETCLSIQQPEVHLHPKAQAEIGDFFYRVAMQQRVKLVIETHSDFVIDRFRIALGGEKLQTLSAQVVFFEREGKGNKAYPIPIEGDGSYSADQPQAFREFFIREQLSLLGI